jgi:hypothetical protein
MFQNWKWGAVREHVLLPVLARVGSFISGGLLLWNVDGTVAQQVATGAIALGLIAFDLAVGEFNRRSVKAKAVAAFLGRNGG